MVIRRVRSPDDPGLGASRPAGERRCAARAAQTRALRAAGARLAIYDLSWEAGLPVISVQLVLDDTPRGVVLSEAARIARRYGSDKSARFVNGLVDAIAKRISSAPVSEA